MQRCLLRRLLATLVTLFLDIFLGGAHCCECGAFFRAQVVLSRGVEKERNDHHGLLDAAQGITREKKLLLFMHPRLSGITTKGGKNYSPRAEPRRENILRASFHRALRFRCLAVKSHCVDQAAQRKVYNKTNSLQPTTTLLETPKMPIDRSKMHHGPQSYHTKWDSPCSETSVLQFSNACSAAFLSLFNSPPILTIVRRITSIIIIYVIS
jgi:hypothetical protein